MFKIALIGDYDSVYGFAALGLDIFSVEKSFSSLKNQNKSDKNKSEKNNEEQENLLNIAEETFTKVTQSEDNYAIIFITEELYVLLENKIKKYETETLPCIIPIPGVSGNNGVGIKNVKRLVEQAVGSDIIFGNEM